MFSLNALLILKIVLIAIIHWANGAVKEEPLVFIANPVEAHMPSHWLPLSIARAILANTTYQGVNGTDNKLKNSYTTRRNNIKSVRTTKNKEIHRQHKHRKRTTASEFKTSKGNERDNIETTAKHSKKRREKGASTKSHKKAKTRKRNKKEDSPLEFDSTTRKRKHHSSKKRSTKPHNKASRSSRDKTTTVSDSSCSYDEEDESDCSDDYSYFSDDDNTHDDGNDKKDVTRTTKKRTTDYIDNREN